ncbi:hypothetical protein [Streptomyces chartreusis]
MAIYQSSGLGPTAFTPPPPTGSPELYTNMLFTQGSTRVTVTEAQALVVLRNIKTNLEATGLTLADVIIIKTRVP